MRVLRLLVAAALLALAAMTTGCEGEPRCKCGSSGDGMDCDPCQL